MRRSRLNFVIPQLFLAAACGSFGQRGLDGTVPAPSDAGIAGYSYDAGIAQGGQAGVKPAKPPYPPTTDDSSSAGEGASGARPDSHANDGGASSAGSRDELGDGGHDATASTGGIVGLGAAGRGGAASGGRSGGAGQAAGGRSAGGRAQAGASATGGAAGHAGGAGSGGVGGHAGTAELAGAGNAAGASGSATIPRPILFSEYVEGSSNFKALELRALSSTWLDGCAVVTYSNGNGQGHEEVLEGALPAGKAYVVCSSSLAAELHETCDHSANLNFNGNDAVALECDGISIDVIGQIGVNPGTAWTASGVSTANQTLRRLCSVAEGHASSSEAFDPSVEWQSFALDDFSDLGHSGCD